MTRLRTATVVIRFLHKEPGCGSSLTSDSQRLLSYGEVIGRWQGEVLVLPQVEERHQRNQSMLREIATDRDIEIEG